MLVFGFAKILMTLSFCKSETIQRFVISYLACIGGSHIKSLGSPAGGLSLAVNIVAHTERKINYFIELVRWKPKMFASDQCL